MRDISTHAGSTEQSGMDDYLFLCGGDMDPTAVRSAYPSAQFVARAHLAEAETDAVPWLAPVRDQTDEPLDVWGILLRITGTDDAASRHEVVTDDERRFAAHLGTTAATAGSPKEILAAARYWELSPRYVGQLRAAFPATETAADDDG